MSKRKGGGKNPNKAAILPSQYLPANAEQNAVKTGGLPAKYGFIIENVNRWDREYFNDNPNAATYTRQYELGEFYPEVAEVENGRVLVEKLGPNKRVRHLIGTRWMAMYVDPSYADAREQANKIDRAYFEAHPGEAMYIREYIFGEFELEPNAMPHCPLHEGECACFLMTQVVRMDTHVRKRELIFVPPVLTVD